MMKNIKLKRKIRIKLISQNFQWKKDYKFGLYNENDLKLKRKENSCKIDS